MVGFEGGRLVVNLVDLPVKCPVAPPEFCFLADCFLHRRGVRDRVELTYVTSLAAAFTKATSNPELSGLLARKGLSVVTDSATGEVDGVKGHLSSFDGLEVDFDLPVAVPVHGGAAYVDRSDGSGDALAFVPTQGTLQAEVKPHLWVIGDASDLRASKAGSGRPLRGRGPRPQPLPLPEGRGARRPLRRAHQLLHRDRVRQGPCSST
jgi:sulfide:quinone oxidoreductase